MIGRQKGSSKAKNENGTWNYPRYNALFGIILTDKTIIIPLDDDVWTRIVLEFRIRNQEQLCCGLLFAALLTRFPVRCDISMIEHRSLSPRSSYPRSRLRFSSFPSKSTLKLNFSPLLSTASGLAEGPLGLLLGPCGLGGTSRLVLRAEREWVGRG